MKKATPTPKELARRRLAKSSIMKIPLDERDNIDNKENVNPGLKFYNNVFQRKDRVTENFGTRNPFNIPQTERIFSKGRKPKKLIPEPVIMTDVHTVCDFYNSFYKVIEGRPLRRNDDIKVYMSQIRDICLFKANAAYLLERIIQIDAAHVFEINEYEKIDAMYTQVKNAFMEFAKLNYQASKKFQMIAQVRALELERKSEELDIVCEKFVKLRNKLSVIKLTYQNLARYRIFLDAVTPIWWSTKNAHIIADIVDANSFYFNLRPRISLKSGGSIEINKDTVENLKKVDSQPYFAEPFQLLNLFEDMRMQCLNYLDMAVYSDNIITSVLKGRDALKANVEEDIKELQSYIDIYNDLITFEEQKEETYKKKFFKILTNEFQELFASFDAIKMFTCIQYVNTKIFGDPEDPKDNIMTLMSNLEKYYLELSLNMDALDVEIVRKATSKAFADDITKMKKAYQAQRALKEWDILRKSLYASFEPSRSKKNKDVFVKNAV